VRDGSDTLIASYYYDPFGRRLWKDVNSVKTYFVYADEGLVGEYDSTGTELKTYGYTPNSTWTTDPLFMKENGTYYFYQNDHLGTPQKLTATNGAVVWSATYESFGRAMVDVETVENNLRFPGQYYDEETGLHYNYFRYYDVIIGRYVRIDPIRYQIRSSLYSYALNNIIKWIDNIGLAPTSCCTDDAGRQCSCDQIKFIFLRVQGGSVGHVFIETPERIVGFYPANRWSVAPGDYYTGRNVKGKMKKDAGHLYDWYNRFKACPDTQKKLEESIEKHKNDNYQLGNRGKARNCAGWALERLQDAGFITPVPPDTTGLRPSDLIPTN